MDMDYRHDAESHGDFSRFNRPKSRVLLREPERCRECNGVFISLYALRSCKDHESLERL